MKAFTPHAIRLMALAVITAIAASCSRDRRELLSLVPDDVDFAMTINALQLASDAGCSIGADGSVQMPEYMESLIRSHKLPEGFGSILTDLSHAIDLEHIVCYGYGNSPLIAFAITDADRFESIITPADTDKQDGFTLYRKYDKGITIVTNDDIGWLWITDTRNPVTIITEAADKAKTAPISKKSGLNDALTADNTFNAVYDPSFIDSSLGNHWLSVSGKIESQTMLLTVRGITPDGEIMTISGTQEINTDFLRYVPSDFTLAAAAGLTADINWGGFAAIIGLAGGYRSRGLVDTLLPYLRSIDGTVAIAAGPADESAWTELDMDHWRFLAMIHMPQDRISQATSQVAMLLRQMRLPVTADAPGLISTEYDGTTYRIGNIDGYFTIASIPMEPTANNQLATTFLGKQAGASVTIPSLSHYLGERGDFGMEIRFALERQEATLKINLTDTDTPILAALLPLFLDL